MGNLPATLHQHEAASFLKTRPRARDLAHAPTPLLSGEHKFCETNPFFSRPLSPPTLGDTEGYTQKSPLSPAGGTVQGGGEGSVISTMRTRDVSATVVAGSICA